MRLTPNVALTGKATQSSVWIDFAFASSPFVASYANDGNMETSQTASSTRCSIVKSRPTPVWWQVQLDRVYEIHRVAITAIDGSGGKLGFSCIYFYRN